MEIIEHMAISVFHSFREIARSELAGVQLLLSFFLSFFLSLPSNWYKSVQTEYKSGQDRKAARAALITTLNTTKTHVI